MTQKEREAALDLLVLSIFADSHISLAEDEEMQRAITSLGWDSERPQSIHFLNSMSDTRAALASPKELDAYLADRAECIRNKESRAATLQLISGVFAKDGTVADENAMLARIEKVFAAYA